MNILHCFQTHTHTSFHTARNIYLNRPSNGEFGSEDNPINLALIVGDGTGGYPNTEKPRDVKGKLLIDHVQDTVDSLKETFGIHLNIIEVNTSMRKRIERMLDGTLKDKYTQDANTIIDECDGRALKLPTITPTATQIAEYLCMMKKENADTISDQDLNKYLTVLKNYTDESGEKVFAVKIGTVVDQYGISFKEVELSDEEADQIASELKLARKSPNGKIRKAVNGHVIPRTHEPIAEHHEKPDIRPFRVEVLGEPDCFEEADGKFYRRVSIQLAKQRAEEIINSAQDGDTIVMFCGKQTINDFDAALGIVLKEAVENSEKDITFQEQLSDSAAPQFLMGKYENHIVVCPPEKAPLFQAIANIDVESLPDGDERAEIAQNMKPIRVHRCATGFSYGEKFQPDKDYYRETYTMDSQVIQNSAQMALKYAAEIGQKVIVIVPDANNRESSVNTAFLAEARKVLTAPDTYEVMTLPEVVTALIKNPADERFQSVLVGNDGGDHLSDIIPGIQHSKIGPAALGLVESAIVRGGLDNRGKTVEISESGAGTAPTLLETSELLAKLVPEAVLGALYRQLAANPTLTDTVHQVGKQLHAAMLRLVRDSFKDWPNFSQKVFERAQTQ